MSLKKTFALCAALFCALTALVFALDHLCLTLVGEGEKTLVILPGDWSSPIMEYASTLFPEPDSPTIPITSCSFI